MYNFSKETKLNDSAKVTESEVILPISTTYFVSSSFNEEEAKKTPFNTYVDGWSSFRGWEARGGVSSWTSKEFHFSSPEVATNAFLMDSDNDNRILALFEKPELIEFMLIENKVINLMDDKYPTVVSTKINKGGEEFKNELLNDQRFKDVYQEILREKATFEKKEKADREKEAYDKRENNYHQWLWLEKKRLNGEFTEFINAAE